MAHRGCCVTLSNTSGRGRKPRLAKMAIIVGTRSGEIRPRLEGLQTRRIRLVEQTMQLALDTLLFVVLQTFDVSPTATIMLGGI